MIMGRQATGRTTKVIRVPLDFDEEKAKRLYYDLLPSLAYWAERSQQNPTSPRYEALRKLLDEACLSDML